MRREKSENVKKGKESRRVTIKILNYQTEFLIQVILVCNVVVFYKFRIRFHFSVLTLKLETKPTGLSFWKFPQTITRRKNKYIESRAGMMGWKINTVLWQ